MKNPSKKSKIRKYFYFRTEQCGPKQINFRNADETSHKRPLESDDASEQAKKLRVESLLDDIK